MSFPFRDRPSLRDRLRGFGKSGDEIMEQLKQSLDEDRKNFFESNSKFGRPSGFSRGFPFDDDVMHGKSKLKDHLEDLARRHPELADQLKDWADIEKSPKIPRGGGSGDQGQSEPRVHQKPPEDSGQGPSRPQQNLRNTVPDMQAQEKLDQLRNARSQSAPPEGPPGKGPIPMPQVNSQTPPNDQQSSQQQQNQNHQPQNQQSQQPQQNQQPPQPQVRGNERYIPIFVEGRNETIVNVPTEKDQGAHAQTPPPRQKKNFKTPQGPTLSQQPPHQGQVPTSPPGSPAPSAAPSQEGGAQQSQPQQQQPQQAPPPAQPPRPPSPLTMVAIIQKEVEDLKHRVDTFKGSKTDKEYIYLDEMLTRNLLKLDNIDSEGREEVRAARKEVIKLIQQCITTLENLKPNP